MFLQNDFFFWNHPKNLDLIRDEPGMWIERQLQEKVGQSFCRKNQIVSKSFDYEPGTMRMYCRMIVVTFSTLINRDESSDEPIP